MLLGGISVAEDVEDATLTSLAVRFLKGHGNRDSKLKKGAGGC